MGLSNPAPSNYAVGKKSSSRYRADNFACGHQSAPNWLDESPAKRNNPPWFEVSVEISRDNAMQNSNDNDEGKLRDLLEKLRAEHRELDAQIMALEADASTDHLELNLMKRKKLFLKDEIIAIENKLLPDIIA